MRFTVGEATLFLQIHHESVGVRFTNLYRPWVDKLLSLKVRKLSCVEHYRVPSSGSLHLVHLNEAVLCDGFIFQDCDAEHWYNQYPVAHYNRLNESANWTLRYQGRRADKRGGRVESATVYLERIVRGMRDLQASPEGSEEMLESLQQHYHQIEQLLKSEFDLKIHQSPYTVVFPETDQSLEFPNIIKISFQKLAV